MESLALIRTASSVQFSGEDQTALAVQPAGYRMIGVALQRRVRVPILDFDGSRTAPANRQCDARWDFKPNVTGITRWETRWRILLLLLGALDHPPGGILLLISEPDRSDIPAWGDFRSTCFRGHRSQRQGKRAAALRAKNYVQSIPFAARHNHPTTWLEVLSPNNHGKKIVLSSTSALGIALY